MGVSDLISEADLSEFQKGFILYLKTDLKPLGIGHRSAWAQMSITLARLIYTFDITLVGHVKEDFGQNKAFPLWEKEPMMIQLSLNANGK